MVIERRFPERALLPMPFGLEALRARLARFLIGEYFFNRLIGKRYGHALYPAIDLTTPLVRESFERSELRDELLAFQQVADALPMNTVQLTVDGKRVRGYYAADIAAAWERIRPEDPEDALIPEERNPFEVDDEDCTGSARGDMDVSAGQHEVHEVLA